MLGHALLAAVAYLIAARYSLVLQDLAGLGAMFWPGAGVTLTALLASPRRSWPAILVAVGLVELGSDLVLGFGLPASLLWSVANVAEPLLAAWLIERWRAYGFEDVRAAVRFIGAIVVAPLLGAAIGAIGTGLAGVSVLAYHVVVGQWLVGDALGMLVVAPFGLVLFRPSQAHRLWSTEGVLALLTVGATTAAVFTVGDAGEVGASAYLVLIPMLWAAVRLEAAGAAAAVFLMGLVGNAFHALGEGPFAGPDPTLVAGSVQLQLFLATTGVTVLMLGCRTVESHTAHQLAAARAQLVDAVSHELRTPLTPILGFGEMLLERGQLDPQARQGLEVIQRNARHLTSLVEDLLWASRGRRGALPVSREMVSMAAALDELLADRDDGTVQVTVQPPDLRALVDRTHLTQILTNLLDNARRYGRPPIGIQVTCDEDHVHLAVTDRGEGVPDWFIPTLFDEFAQVTNGNQRPSLGLGLGLPIARTLARANGGDITYQRDHGETRFVLRLPAADASDGASSSSSGGQRHTGGM